MILYNITIIVDSDIEIEFREWARLVYLPQIHRSNLFKSQSFLQMTDSPNEGTTFCLQMISANDEGIESFKKTQLTLFHDQCKKVWVDKVFIFESKMQYLAML